MRNEHEVSDRSSFIEPEVGHHGTSWVAEGVVVAGRNDPIRVVADYDRCAGLETAADVLAKVASEHDLGPARGLNVLAHSVRLPRTDVRSCEVSSLVR